ncbi:head completion/stabilization protein [Citrobacter sp. FP75]|uniref:head completion/stabilization protein n=1 Tax=Citrobacter sp. FP75 TaxID=1852949 RepID=UPI001BC957D4|nr:head completion/stabilization protein [Citrobacter sp. FP75]
MFSGTPIDYQDATLTNDGFWPDLSLKEFQEQRSIPPDIDAGTVGQALITAAGEVNSKLQSVSDSNIGSGYATAAAVPGIVIDGTNLLCGQYKKAVYALAKADLMGEFASIGRRESHPGQESADTRNGLIAEASMVIRAVKGLPRATVRMI